MVNKFERESPVVKEHIISKQEGSEIGNLESELEPVQLQGEIGECVVGRESPEGIINMGEHRVAD